ncbi:DinB family protein [Rhodocytophaga aerolata]|uniref:DinB family protein n=1 Tax=Rhodocytophaga aerolata TaxID=455078 RepID=A0ABT8REC3_9BACT|nr:DinB family protein [Rhodocytophaga aerolata]MDO1450026.1 DinB family protein [Rhodocytophaga aerolata]
MSLTNTPTLTQDTVSFSASFVPLWERAKNYTIDMAEAMPEEHYSYAPVNEIRTFAQQMVHLAQATNMLCAGFLTGEPCPLEDGKGIQTKAEIIDFLSRSFDYMGTAVDSLAEEELNQKVMIDFLGIELTKKEIVYFIRDHSTHHRSQALIYLRAKGIKPPQYRGW